MTTYAFSSSNLHLEKAGIIPKPPKHHPFEELLMNGNAPIIQHGRNAHEKLLVLMVDFVRESPDDPYTTGDGTFQLEADSSYKITIGAPPHDKRYYEANLEALRLYYLAASLGSFNLSYDIWPHDGTAYTLPNKMSYYSPANASSSLFLSRMEEYFKASFELADSLDPEIDFSQYDHYMIIHAGSDWQHDVLGDTPCDIPSFYIHVATGKEAIVDNGTVTISHACNVPEAITQDIQISQSDSSSYVTGYGALNGVYAHEFGHSMGLVDLYNVRTFQPEVGVFDIMDSGGSSQIVLQGDNNSVYAVEGILPALPGAWSRIKMFEQDFRQRGILLDASEVGDNTLFDLKAAESKFESANPKPYFVKIPISNSEYVLLENRSVDPDNDGGTYFIGIDPNDPTNHDSPNKRVILAPTPAADNLYTPSYEYDYLLPSWVGASPSQYFDHPAIGGGILAWHIDDDVIYHSGTISDGEFVSNYANNSVNTIHSHRGIQVFEADGLPDIGNPYSYYWTGTPYEYFFKYRPIIDSDGYFDNWSNIPWKQTLSSISDPPLLSNHDAPSIYAIGINSIPTNFMQISISSLVWSGLTKLGTYQNLLALGPIVAGEIYGTDLPIISSDNIQYMTHEYDVPQHVDSWQNLYGSVAYETNEIFQPIVTSDIDQDGLGEYSIVSGNTVHWWEGFQTQSFSIPDSLITDAPLYYGQICVIPGQEKLYSVQVDPLDKTSLYSSIDIPHARIIGYYNYIYALSDDILYYLDIGEDGNLTIVDQYHLTGHFSQYEPIGFRNSDLAKPNLLFLMSDEGNLYRFDMLKQTLILKTKDYTAKKPTQLAIGKSSDGEFYITFAANQTCFAFDLDGVMKTGFPYLYDHVAFTPYGYPYIVNFPDLLCFLYPDDRGGFFAISRDGARNDSLSFFWNSDSKPYELFYETASHRLYNAYSDLNGNVFTSYMSGFDTNPIVWNGYRNQGSGFYRNSVDLPSDSGSFTAYIYPNPITKGYARIHTEHMIADAHLKIYDISGKLMQSVVVPKSDSYHAEKYIDMTKCSSGVYLCTAECSGHKVRFKIAVEK